MFNPYSVAEVSIYIRELFDHDLRLQDLWITGEISNMTRASSGHWYFTVKDSKAQLKCAMWRSNAERQQFIPKNGDAVNVHGRVSVYEPRGEYQLYADSIRPAGVGNLYAQFEELKARLEAEGLFAMERKRLLPAFPLQIGIVTSPEAAAFQDVQNVLRRRFPLATLVLSPTPVQGEIAPPRIVAALERLNAYSDVNVILLIRGGGSIEDLWAFNAEEVARAVAESPTPIISGVGHETDFTIVDFVADYRAPTPSAAAEIATPSLEDLQHNVRVLHETLRVLMEDHIRTHQGNLTAAQRTLGHISPQRQVGNLRQRVDDLNLRLLRQQRQDIERRRERLVSREAALHAASPQALLERGYAIVTHSSGTRIKSTQDVQLNEQLTIRLHDGQVQSRVEDKTNE